MPDKTKSPPGSFAKLMESQPDSSLSSKSPTPPPSKKKINKKIKKTKERANKHASMHARKHVNMHAYMHTIVEKKATNSFAFRYPPDLLEKLEEAVHLVWMKYKVKLTKNSVAVSAMAYLLWDFESNGKNSILYKVLIKESK